MYFLNDKHTPFQYAIYCKCKNGEPYICAIYDSIEQVYLWVESKEKQHIRYNQPFFIDNDFYKNKYPLGLQGSFYYKILRRRVNDWEEFSFAEDSNNNDTSKIVDLLAYKYNIGLN